MIKHITYKPGKALGVFQETSIPRPRIGIGPLNSRSIIWIEENEFGIGTEF